MAYDQASHQPDEKSENKRARRWLDRSDALFNKFRLWHVYWQSLAEVFYPERADFTITRAEANERIGRISASEPIILARTMSDNFGAMLRPRARKWFNCTARPEELVAGDAEKRWLAKATNIQRNIIYDNTANFTRCMAESDRDYTVFGNAVVAHTYNATRTGVFFRAVHLKACAWIDNPETAQTIEFHEKLCRPLEHFAALFGAERLPKSWQKDLETATGRLKEVEILRIVGPVDAYDGIKRPPVTATHFGLYLVQARDDKECCILEEVWYESFPYTVRQWLKVSGEAVARSPCTGLALPEARQLNVIEDALALGIEMAVDPPRVAIHGHAVGNSFNLRAGGITFLSPDYDRSRHGDPLKALEVGDPRYAMEYKQSKLFTLGRAFWTDLMKLPDKEMTAFETAKWHEQTIREAAPVFEPMEAENAHMMESVFIRGLRQGAFGRVLPDGTIEGMPESLQDGDISFEFETPLTQAMRELKAEKFRLLVQDASAIMATQNPDMIEALDNIDMDAAAVDYLEGAGEENWRRTPDDRDMIREQRMEAQQKQAEAEAAMAATDSIGRAKPENLAMMRQELEAGGGLPN